MERFTRRMINTILLCLLAIGTAATIWDALPGLIKVVAIVAVVVGFINVLGKSS